MSDFKNKKKNQLKLEFVKSTAMLLLAFVLLISVALAWFERDGIEDIEAATISVYFESPEESDVGLGSEVTTDRTVVLPCATKLGEAEIDKNDFVNAVVVDVYTIEAASNVNVEVSVKPNEGSSDNLHYYVCCDYSDATTVQDLAKLIFENHSKENNPNDTPGKFTMPPNDDKKVAIVYWADYDDAFETSVNGNEGKYEYSVLVHFRALNEAEDE